MKELSIEEKAKRYDIALDKIKRLLGTGSSCSREELKYVFPELAESEDEKIRKELLNYLYDVHDDDEDRARWIAWLEKQGEHQEYPKDVIDNAISFLANRNDGMPEKEAKDIVNAIITVLNPSYWPKQVRQKPTWSGEELDSITAAINNLEYLKNNYVYHQMGLEPAITFLKSLKDRVLQQPKNEWNEDDEKNIESIESFLRCPASIPLDLYNTLTNWLKSLKDRVQPQPKQEWSDDFEEEMDRYIEENFYGSADCFFSNRTKRELEAEDVVRIGCHFAIWQKEQLKKSFNKQKQEWSEEDNKIIEEIINDIECARALNYYAPKEGYEFRKNWLKSIRPQSTWKPSDEQMESLKRVVERLDNVHKSGNEDVELLCALLHDLNALKYED